MLRMIVVLVVLGMVSMKGTIVECQGEACFNMEQKGLQ